MHIGVLTQILELALLVVGVDGYQHGTDLGGGIEERQPVGHVGSPDTYVGATLHTNGNQTLGEVIHTLVELAPGKAQVAVGVNDVFLIGRGLSPVFEPLTECALVELVACATSLGRVGAIGQWSARHIVFDFAHNQKGM